MTDTADHSHVDTTELARLYFDEGLNLAAIAARSGMSRETVRDRLKAAGYTLRRCGRSVEGSVSTVELARLYFDEGLSLAVVGTRTGMSEAGVGSRLKTAGYTLRSRGPVGAAGNFSTAELARLYFDEGLTLRVVGTKAGMTGDGVGRRLKTAGYTLRPRAAPFSIAELERLYFDEELTCDEVAARVGLRSSTVRSHLNATGKQLRRGGARPKVPTAHLVHLYFDEGLHCGQVAERVGLTRRAVVERLKREGRHLRPPMKSAGRTREGISASDLECLYFGERIDIEGIVLRTGLPTARVRAILTQIRRPLRGDDSQSRHVATSELIRLHFDEGLDCDVIAARLRVTRATVVNRLKLAGYAPRNKHTTALTTKEMARLRNEEGLSLAEIGRRAGISAHAVGARVRRVSPEMPDGRAAAVPTAELTRLLSQEGTTIAQIAEHVGMTRQAVWARLNRRRSQEPSGR